MVINSTEHLTEGNNCGYFSAGDTRFCDFLDFVTVMPIPKCPIVIVALSDFVTNWLDIMTVWPLSRGCHRIWCPLYDGRGNLFEEATPLYLQAWITNWTLNPFRSSSSLARLRNIKVRKDKVSLSIFIFLTFPCISWCREIVCVNVNDLASTEFYQLMQGKVKKTKINKLTFPCMSWCREIVCKCRMQQWFASTKSEV